MPQISLVTSLSNESALNPIGGIFLLEPLHPRYLGWMILSECHESPAVHRRGIDLNIAVLRIHTINTFRIENIHVYLH